MMGHGKKENMVYLIDFGLAKKFNEFNGFRRYGNGSSATRKMAGTPIYTSINAHMATGGKWNFKFTLIDLSLHRL